MAKFKKGDKVVRKAGWRDGLWSQTVIRPNQPKHVRMCDNWVVKFDDVSDSWDTDKFELYVEPQPEPVTVTEPSVQQIPGVPDGYRAVRIGAPKKGEQFIVAYDEVCLAEETMYNYTWVVVEPIAPPAPPTPIPTTVKVQLNRYLVGCTNETHCVLICTQEYIDQNYVNYRLLGPSETLELEVEV